MRNSQIFLCTSTLTLNIYMLGMEVILSMADMTMLTDDHVFIVLGVNLTFSNGTDSIFTL